LLLVAVWQVIELACLHPSSISVMNVTKEAVTEELPPNIVAYNSFLCKQGLVEALFHNFFS